MNKTSTNEALSSDQYENLDPRLNTQQLEPDAITAESLNIRTKNLQITDPDWIDRTTQSVVAKVIKALSSSERFAQLVRESKTQSR
tara:strand:+ start:1139 stop:1396 length:258 start_codon:yes stop_codon:yes gene_type:complete